MIFECQFSFDNHANYKKIDNSSTIFHDFEIPSLEGYIIATVRFPSSDNVIKYVLVYCDHVKC